MKIVLIIVGVLAWTLPVLAQSTPANIPPVLLPTQPPVPAPPIQSVPPVRIETPSTPGTQTDPESGVQPITVSRFVYRGNTVISNAELNQVTQPYVGKPLTFNQLLQLRTNITQLYVDRGFVTSAAFLPPQEQAQDGSITIEIIEGKLQQINVLGADRLADYVRSRVAIAASPVVNENKLTQALRLLKLNSLLIQNISGRLEPGTQPGLSVLTLRVEAAPTTSGSLELNNFRSPAIGSFERRGQITQSNLLGLGDTLQIGYRNTQGSNGVDVNYTLPVSPRNTTVAFRYNSLWSRIIEQPFDLLDIRANSRSYELEIAHPIFQRATPQKIQDFEIGLTASRIESDTSLLGVNFPLSAGADEQGRTRLTVLRFFQEYKQQSDRQSLLLRSQFNVGSGLGATENPTPPDGRFFAWRGQGVFLQRLGNRPYLVLRSDLQFADRSLVPLEQISLGGLNVRGYRQDARIGDNGIAASGEVHFPLYTSDTMELKVVPFIDVGHLWGQGTDTQIILASTGLGVQWNWQGLQVNLTYGIPLIPIERIGTTLQENGLTASVSYFWRF